MSVTVNRGKLLRWVRKGLLEFRVDSNLTDDYRRDAENRCYATDWVPAESSLEAPYSFASLHESDFQGSGGAWVDRKDPTLIHLVPYGNRCLMLRLKSGEAWK